MYKLESCEVLIVGAGPVGLLLANLLGQVKIRTIIIDQQIEPVAWSRAIGISPPSLEILNKIGLADAFVETGCPISTVGIHGNKGWQKLLGNVSFANIPSNYPFMLSIPQTETERLLRENLLKYTDVHIQYGITMSNIHVEKTSVLSTVQQMTLTSDSFTIQSNYVCACDGANSTVRTLLGLNFRGKRYTDTFVMGDFVDRAQWGDCPGFGKDAHLFFTTKGAVESFPLPAGRRRWIIQTRNFEAVPTPDLIANTVAERTGIPLDKADLLWQSPFGVKRYEATRFQSGPVFLLGDAAHVMSPIGGQGMNTGFADADRLAPIIQKLLTESAETYMVKTWENTRKHAYRVAANRAWRSMRLGTIRGSIPGTLRNLILWIMLNGPFKKRIPIDYAMLSIPHTPHYKKAM